MADHKEIAATDAVCTALLYVPPPATHPARVRLARQTCHHGL